MALLDRVHLIVAAQQREFPRLDYSAKAVAGRLVRLGALFIEAIGRVADRFGLSGWTNEYVILCALRAAGAPFTLPPKSIRPLLGLTSGGMTNILHDLENRGLVERLPDPADRRGVLILLTDQALTLIAQSRHRGARRRRAPDARGTFIERARHSRISVVEAADRAGAGDSSFGQSLDTAAPCQRPGHGQRPGPPAVGAAMRSRDEKSKEPALPPPGVAG